MELVVVDLAGPMSIETWSGMSYVFMAVEASTRMGVAELMVSKNETPEILKATVAKLECQSGIKLKRMRSDNGMEFVNNVVHSFCWRNGIIYETSVPYTPEQNGIAESAIRVCFEMVRCMLHLAGMDLQYWGEAFMYAVHIHNLSPTSAIQDNIPLHVWSR
jgi:transposase InsO family protein